LQRPGIPVLNNDIGKFVPFKKNKDENSFSLQPLMPYMIIPGAYKFVEFMKMFLMQLNIQLLP